MSALLGNTVVALYPNARHKKLERDQSDVTNPLGQLNYARLLTRKWPCLPDTEFKLISFIFGRTVLWGELDRYFTYRFFRYGDQKSVGIGKGETQIRQHLASLERRGVISIDREKAHLYGLKITINLSWEPSADIIPAPKQVKDRGSQTLREDDSWNHAPRESEVPSHGKSGETTHGSPRDIIEEHSGELYTEEPFSLHSASRRQPEDFGGIDLEEGWGSSTASPPISSFPPVAPPPLPDTKTEQFLSRAQTNTQGPLANTENRLNPGAIYQTYRAAFFEFHSRPGVVFKEWTGREMGQIKHGITSKWRGTPPECHTFVRWALENWMSVIVNRIKFIKRDSRPEVPDVGFFVRFIHEFMTAFAARNTVEWLKSITSPEQREMHRLMVQEGLTEDQARMRLLENRMFENKCKELAERERRANDAFRRAQIAEANARRIGTSTPHPKSVAAREIAAAQRREEQRLYREKHGIVPLADGEIPDFSNIKPWGEQ